MITGALIRFVMASFRAVISALPTWVVPTVPVAGMAGSVGNAAGLANGYFPLTTLLACLAFIVVIKAGLFGWRVVVFIYHQFWGSN